MLGRPYNVFQCLPKLLTTTDAPPASLTQHIEQDEEPLTVGPPYPTSPHRIDVDQPCCHLLVIIVTLTCPP